MYRCVLTISQNVCNHFQTQKKLLILLKMTDCFIWSPVSDSDVLRLMKSNKPFSIFYKARRCSQCCSCYTVVQHTQIKLLAHRPCCPFAFLKISAVGQTDKQNNYILLQASSARSVQQQWRGKQLSHSTDETRQIKQTTTWWHINNKKK